MNKSALSGVMLLFTMLDDTLNLNVVNLLPAHNSKVYTITSEDETLEINLKGNELYHLSDFAEDIIEYICDEHRLDDIELYRTNISNMGEQLAEILNYYNEEISDTLKEGYPEAKYLEPLKIEYLEPYMKIISNLRAHSNEHDLEDDVLSHTQNLMVECCYLDNVTTGEDILRSIKYTDMQNKEAEEERTKHAVTKNFLKDKERLSPDKVRRLDLDRIKMMLFSRFCTNFSGGYQPTTAFENILQQSITDGKTFAENILFHDKKSAVGEHALLKIKMLNSITGNEYENIDEQEIDAFEKVKDDMLKYTNIKYTQNHFDFINHLIELSTITNYGRERTLLETFILTLITITVRQNPPVRNLSALNRRMSIKEFESIIENNYNVVQNNREAYLKAINSLNQAIKIFKEKIDTGMLNNIKVVGLDELPQNQRETLLNFLNNLPNLDDLISPQNPKSKNTPPKKTPENKENLDGLLDEFEYLTDDERKVLEEYLPDDLDDDELLPDD